MKVIIDIDENIYTRLFNNGIDISKEDMDVLQTSVRLGIVKSDESISDEVLAHEAGYSQCKRGVIRTISKQYTEHGEIVPAWLSIGDLSMRGLI